jgi:hypothetical protein
MFLGQAEIEPLVELLEQRQTSLWHACQLQDLRSYIELEGIPSRSLLEQNHKAFTAFKCDAADRSNGVWDKVFLNLDDFGRAFAWGATATPNAYGPIALQLHPRALMHASDVAVCLRSAGASDFDRDGEALATVEDVDRAYRHRASNGFHWSTMVRFGEHLQEAFGETEHPVRTPEVSLTSGNGCLPFDSTIVVWVDPLELLSGGRLVDHVRTVVPAPTPVQERSMSGERRVVYGDVVRVLAEDGLDIVRLLAGRGDVDAGTRAWAAAIHDRGLQWLYERFGGYLRIGTIAPIQAAGIEFRPIARERVTEDRWWEMRLDPSTGTAGA